MSSNREYRLAVAVVIVLMVLGLFGAVGASPARPPRGQAQEYSAACSNGAQGDLWAAYVADWWTGADSFRAGMSPLCQHRAQVLTVALDVCFERYDEALGEYFYALWLDGEYLNDAIDSDPYDGVWMSRDCAWAAESLGYSISGWFEGYKGAGL